MTKRVRIENADNSNYQIVVEVWERRDGGDELIDTIRLLNPTDMTFELYLWEGRYLTVREEIK